MTALRPMGPREWVMLIALSILWGGSFFYNAILVKALPAFTIVFLRVLIALLGLLVVLKAMKQRLPASRDAIIAFAGMGLLNNVIPFSLFVWAQGHIPGGLAAILNGTTPLFTVVVLHLFTSDEKATARKVIGVAVGFFGVAAMVGLDALSGVGGRLLPELAALGGALSYAFSGLWGRRFARLNIPPVAAASGQMCASSLLLLPLVLIFDQPWTLPMPGVTVWLAALGLALLSTSLAYILFFRILAVAGATNLLLVTFLIPISAILLGVLFLGETLQAKHILGMALIGIGLAFIDGRLIDRITGRT